MAGIKIVSIEITIKTVFIPPSSKRKLNIDVPGKEGFPNNPKSANVPIIKLKANNAKIPPKTTLKNVAKPFPASAT